MATTMRERTQPAQAVRPARSSTDAAQRLSLAVAALAAVAAAVGVFVPDVYQDDPSLREMFRGYDLVTLAVVVPTLLVSLRAARRGSERGRLVWLGMLGFTVYNYALYVFGASFNDLFLVHVAILVAAAVALGIALLRYDHTGGGELSAPAARTVAGVLAFLGLGLGAMWMFYAVRFAITGEAPAESELVVPLAATHLGYALDLTLLVPAYLWTAALLWRRCRGGGVKVVAAVLLIAGLGQQLAYVTALVFQARADIAGATAFDPNEPLIIVAYALGIGVLFRHRRGASRGK